MKFNQLRYMHEIAKHNLNVTLAAEALHTSQPGVSKQIQLLEDELNVQIFKRNGKRLIGVTEPGKQVLAYAEKIMREMENIKRIGEDFTNTEAGSLTIATTHSQARYYLPKAIQAFAQEYPQVKLTLHQGSPQQVTQQVIASEADIGIATETIADAEELVTFECYQWNRCLVVPIGHELLQEKTITLQKIAEYPLITYDFAFTGGTLVSKTFHQAGVEPNVVLTAIDADVIKTYVMLGMGIGLLANIAYDVARDKDLVAIDVSALFKPSTTYVAVRKDAYLRGFVYDFMQLLAPTYNRQAIREKMHQDLAL